MACAHEELRSHVGRVVRHHAEQQNLQQQAERGVRGFAHIRLSQPPLLTKGRFDAFALAVVDRTVGCDSGNVRATGVIDDATRTGSLTITYNACRVGEDTLSGSATVRVDAYDLVAEEITDLTVSFERLSLSGAKGSGEIAGSVRAQVDIAKNTERVTANFVARSGSGRMVKVEGLALIVTYDNFLAPRAYSESRSSSLFQAAGGWC